MSNDSIIDAARNPEFPSVFLHFRSRPGTAATLSDRHLALLLDAPSEILVPQSRAILVAELWTRKWLYETRCPPDFSKLTLEVLSSQFEKAYEVCVKFLRHPHPDSEPNYESYMTVPHNLNEFEAQVWAWFCRRLESFLNCDGLIAFVSLHDDDPDNAVAVPFRLTSGIHACVCDINNTRHELWSDRVAQLMPNPSWPVGITVDAQFPELIEDRDRMGTSFLLPVVLAYERLQAVQVPEFLPLDVLATGSIEQGKIADVSGIPAKHTLSKRLGCLLFVAPSGAPEDGMLVVRAHTSLDSATEQFSRVVKPSKSIHRAWLNVNAVHLRREKARDSNETLPRGFWEEAERRLSWCDTVLNSAGEKAKEPKRRCRRLMHEAKGLLGTLSSDNIQRKTDSILSMYRGRPLYGRDKDLQHLDAFLQHPGGGLMLVTGKSHDGKTALLSRWCDSVKAKGGFAVCERFFSTKAPDPQGLFPFYKKLAGFLYSVAKQDLPLNLDTSLREDPKSEILFILKELMPPPDQRQPILLLLDGLDEAEEEYFMPPFDQEALAGIHVVASVRTGGKMGYGEACPWKKWEELAKTETLVLHGLLPEDILSWLRNTQDMELRGLETEPQFVKGVAERSEGSPGYLQEMFEELVRFKDLRHNWSSIIEKFPPGYGSKVRQDFEQSLRQSNDACRGDGERLKDLAVLVAAAKGPLPEADLFALAQLNRKLPADLSAQPDVAWRWMVKAESEPGRFCLGLSQPLFKDVLRERYRDDFVRFGVTLRTFCQNWRNNHGIYAVRYLPSYLIEERNWAELADTLKSHEFLQRLREAFPNDVALPLDMAQSALRIAIAEHDAAGIAEMMLAHAELVSQLSNPDGLEVKTLPILDRAQHFAKVLAPLMPTAATMWRLLAVLDHHKRGEREDVDKLLDDLDSSSRVTLVGAWADMAAASLAEVLPATDSRLISLSKLLLDDEARCELARRVSEKKQKDGFYTAWRIAEAIGAPYLSRRAHSAVLCAMVVREEWDGAFRRVAEIKCKDAQSENEARSCMLLSIAEHEARQSEPNLDRLEETVGRLHDLAADTFWEKRLRSRHAQAKAWLGSALFAAGYPHDASTCFGEARTFACRKDCHDKPWGFVTFRALVESHARLLSQGAPHLGRNLSAGLLLEALESADAAWKAMDHSMGSNNYMLLTERVNFLGAASALQPVVPALAERIDEWDERLHDSPRYGFLTHSDKASFLVQYIGWLSKQKDTDSRIAKALLALGELDTPSKYARAIRTIVMQFQLTGPVDSWHAFLIDKPAARSAAHASKVLLAIDADSQNLDEAISEWESSLRCSPRLTAKRQHKHINIAEACARVGVGAEKKGATALSARCFSAASSRIKAAKMRPAEALRHWVTLAELAHKAMCPTAVAEAWEEAERLILPVRRVVERVRDAKARGVSYLPPVAYMEQIEAWCSFARLAELKHRGRGAGELDDAYELARAWKEAHSTRTKAFAEIAEARSLLGDYKGARSNFKSQKEFIYGLTDKDRLGGGAMRDQLFCLMQLVSGMVKAGAHNSALCIDALDIYRSEAERDPKKGIKRLAFYEHDEARRALAVAYATLSPRDVDWDHLPQQPDELSDRRRERRITAWDLKVASDIQVRAINDPAIKARAFSAIAIAHARGGRQFSERAVGELLRSEDRHKFIHKVAKAFAERYAEHNDSKASESFMRLLPSCAWSFGECYLTLGHLAHHWPETANDIACVFERLKLL